MKMLKGIFKKKENGEHGRFYKLKYGIQPSLFLLPFLIVYTLFFIFPILYGLVISFYDWSLFDSSQNTYVGFSNYIKILFDSDSIYHKYFWEGLTNTLIFVVVSVPLLVVIPFVIAILLDIQPKGYKLFRIILFMPTVFSISAVMLIWKWQFYDNGGFINSIMEAIGIPPIPWLTAQPWTWIAIVIITIWWTMGTNMVILGAGLKNIDKTLYEAASIDGANYFQTLRYITIPALVPQMILVLITTTLASFNIYGQPEMLTGGGPQQSTMVLMMRIRGLALGQNSNPGVATAMAICLGLIMISISLLQAKYIRRGGA